MSGSVNISGTYKNNVAETSSLIYFKMDSTSSSFTIDHATLENNLAHSDNYAIKLTSIGNFNVKNSTIAGTNIYLTTFTNYIILDNRWTDSIVLANSEISEEDEKFTVARNPGWGLLANSVISISNPSGVYVGDDAIITIDTNIQGESKIIVNVTGLPENQEISNNTGTFIISLPNISQGTYDVSVVFEGNDNYRAGSKTSTFTINYHSLTDLKNLIDAATDNTVVLNRDYAWTTGDSVITIAADNLVINGNGHIIDAKGESSIFTITGNNVTINNLTLVNGFTMSNGAAVSWSGANGTVKNTNFTDNQAQSGNGGGLYVTGDNLTIDTCTFTGNVAKCGAAIYIKADEADIVSCSFVDNAAVTGGAVYFEGDNLTVSDSTFEGNQAVNGSSITAVGNGTTLSNVTVSDGSDLEGAGIEITGNNTVIDKVNVTGSNGNAMTVTGNNNTINNTNVSGNDGDGIEINGQGNSISHSDISGNNGTGLVTDGNDNNITDNTITDNLNGVEDNGDNSTISGNTVANNTDTGIIINGNDTNVTGNDIEGNDVSVSEDSNMNDDDKKQQMIDENTGVESIKEPSNLVVAEIDSIEYGNTKINIIVSYDGNYTVTVDDGTPIALTGVSKDTLTEVTIGDVLTLGTHSVKVKFNGNDTYASSEVEKQLTVTQAIKDIDVSADSVDYGTPVSVIVKAPVEGVYTVTINGINSKKSILKDGVEVFEIYGLDANDNYNIEVTGSPVDTQSYAINDNTGVYVKVNQAGSSVDVNPAEGVYNTTVVVSFTIPDNGNATGITDDVKVYNSTGDDVTTGLTIVVDNDAKTITITGLAAGDYTVNVTTIPNGTNYHSDICSGNVHVARAGSDVVVPASTDVDYDGTVVVSVTVENATGVTAKLYNGDVEVGTVTVSGLDITVDVTGLAVGEYTLNVTTVVDGNHKAVTKSGIINVGQTGSDVVVPASTDVDYDGTVVVSVTVENATGVTAKLYNGDVEVGTVTVSGLDITVDVTGLAVGEYTLNVTTVVDGNHKAVTKSGIINVGQAGSDVVVPASTSVDSGSSVVVAVSGLVNATGVTAELYQGSTKVRTLSVDNTKITVDASGLSAGTYTLKVTTDPIDTNHYAVTKSGIVAVWAYSNVAVTGATVIYGGNTTATISGLSGASGVKAELYKGSTKVRDLSVSGNSIAISAADLDVGQYTLKVTTIPNANYYEVSKTAAVTVTPADSTIKDIAPIVMTYNDSTTITVETTGATGIKADLFSGSILIPNKVTVNGNTITIDDVDVGQYTLKVTTIPDSNHNEATAVADVNVTKANVNMSIVAGNVVYPNDVTVIVKSDVAGNYSLFVGTGAPQYVVLEAGVEQVIPFAGLDAGDYEFTLAYLGSDNYNAGSVSDNATVGKAETIMAIDATSPLAGENATVSITLPADATGTVEVKYGNGIYTAPVEDGTVVISVPTNMAGNETASVKYSGDNNYDPASGEVAITVKPNGAIIAENIKRGVNSPYDYYATLVDINGNPVSGVEITFTIAGQTYKATTNASGIATVSAGLGLVDDKDTKYDVIVTNPYTFENTTATTTIVPRLIVVSGDLTADYLENPPYVVQAIGDDGNPVGAGETVKVVFAGFYYDMITNATGHVERTISLTPGMYAVKACYEGYNTTQTVFTVKQVLKVTSGTLKKTAKSYTLKATLKSSNGKAIVGKEVKLTFNGKTYTVKTNSKGVASYTIKSSVIKKLKAGKTYVLKARYVNDIVKGKIKVRK